jgi:hypothetical protein
VNFLGLVVGEVLGFVVGLFVACVNGVLFGCVLVWFVRDFGSGLLSLFLGFVVEFTVKKCGGSRLVLNPCE